MKKAEPRYATVSGQAYQQRGGMGGYQQPGNYGGGVSLFCLFFCCPHKILKVVAFLSQVGTTCKAAVSLVPTLRAPPSEKRSVERVKFLGLIPQDGGSPMRL